jgi:hypothetical protein
MSGNVSFAKAVIWRKSDKLSSKNNQFMFVVPVKYIGVSITNSGSSSGFLIHSNIHSFNSTWVFSSHTANCLSFNLTRIFGS